jgi:hypothetical protein
VAVLDELAQALTRSDLERLRGPLDAGNGAGDLAVPVPNGLARSKSDRAADPVAVCLQCRVPLSGKQERFCSSACRSRYRRTHTEPLPQAARKSPPAVELFPTPTPFDRLVSVCAVLPQGWRLEATASSVTVTWAP